MVKNCPRHGFIFQSLFPLHMKKLHQPHLLKPSWFIMVWHKQFDSRCFFQRGRKIPWYSMPCDEVGWYWSFIKPKRYATGCAMSPPCTCLEFSTNNNCTLYRKLIMFHGINQGIKRDNTLHLSEGKHVFQPQLRTIKLKSKGKRYSGTT